MSDANSQEQDNRNSISRGIGIGWLIDYLMF
jgi:hypothetical protein